MVWQWMEVESEMQVRKTQFRLILTQSISRCPPAPEGTACMRPCLERDEDYKLVSPLPCVINTEEKQDICVQ